MLVTLQFVLCFLHENDGQKHIADDRATSLSQGCREPYRLESSNGYYALLKRGGKQFRRSLETKDRKLADRRLNDLRAKLSLIHI